MIRLFLVFVLMSFQLQAAEPPRFFSSLPDVPLMHDLQELESQTLIFDKPEGRIIESIAQIENASQAEVEKYYAEILPQFGWKKSQESRFIRQDEQLVLSFEKIENQAFLRVTVSPSSISR